MRIDLSRKSIAMIHTGNVLAFFLFLFFFLRFLLYFFFSFFFFFLSGFCFSNSFMVDIYFLKGAELKPCFSLCFFFFKIQKKVRNHEKRFDHGSQNCAGWPRFTWSLLFFLRMVLDAKRTAKMNGLRFFWSDRTV